MIAKNPVDGLSAIHPGEFLCETLKDLAMTQAAFAEAICVSAMRVSHLLKGDRPVTAELALRLGRALGQTPQYWLNLQSAYDLKMAQIEMKDSLNDVRMLALVRMQRRLLWSCKGEQLPAMPEPTFRDLLSCLCLVSKFFDKSKIETFNSLR